MKNTPGRIQLYYICILFFPLTLITVPVPVQAAGHSFNEATLLPFETEVTDTIVSGSTFDYYRIQMPSDGNISIRIRHEDDQENNDWTVDLISSDVGHTVIRTFDHDTYQNFSTTEQEGLAAGTYFIRVKSRSQYNVPEAPYFLRVDHVVSTYYESWPNESFQEANLISTGHDYEGNMSSGNDIDYFRIVLPARGNIAVRLHHEDDQENNDWTVDLISSDVGHTVIRTFDHDTYQNFSTTEQEGLAAGVYFIRISSRSTYNPPDAQYFLKVDYTQSNYYEYWPNGSFQEANPINTGHEYEGNMSSGNDKDYFKIILPSRGNIAVRLHHEDDQENNDWTVDLISSDVGHTVIRTFDHDTYQNFSTTEQEGLAAGVYFIRISSRSTYNPPDAQYFLRVDFTLSDYYEVWPNNIFATATEMAPRYEYQGNISASDDSDYYFFNLPQQSQVFIRFRHENVDERNDWHIDLLTADGSHETLLSFDHDTYYGLLSVKSVTLPAGTFYLRVKPRNTYNPPVSQYFLGAYPPVESSQNLFLLTLPAILHDKAH